MIQQKSTPKQDGYYMPGEFEPHDGCIMIWPERPGSWPFGAKAARVAFANIARAISESETVYMLVNAQNRRSAEQMLPKSVKLLEIESDDAWARDVGPTFVKNREGKVRAVNWSFNAWGGDYDGLYRHFEKDDRIAKEFCKQLGVFCYDAAPFVLEGGSIHCDGEGTVIATEACLLSPGRNPSLCREQIEERLKEYLGAQKIIWLKHGILGDETNEHIDNICAFSSPAELVLAFPDEESHPQYAYSRECLDTLLSSTDAKGRPFRIHKLPMPKYPVCIRKEELSGMCFEEGEDIREEGEPLAASYVNFYISNNGIILPQFEDPNDARAVQILSEIFKGRKIYPIAARDIIVGGGNIHCITQQIPKGGDLCEI